MAIKKFDQKEHGRNVYIEDGVEFDSFIEVLFGDIPSIKMFWYVSILITMCGLIV